MAAATTQQLLKECHERHLLHWPLLQGTELEHLLLAVPLHADRRESNAIGLGASSHVRGRRAATDDYFYAFQRPLHCHSHRMKTRAFQVHKTLVYTV
jgi:hypothetical protein